MITIKDLKQAIKNLDDSLEVQFMCTYANEIDIEQVKEIKENGKEYYKIKY